MSLGSIYSTLNCEWMVIPNTLWLYIVRIHLVMGIFLIDSHLFVLFFYVLHVSQYHYLSINLCAVQLNPAIWIRKLSLMLLMNFVFENSGGLFQWLNFSSIVPFFSTQRKFRFTLRTFHSKWQAYACQIEENELFLIYENYVEKIIPKSCTQPK